MKKLLTAVTLISLLGLCVRADEATLATNNMPSTFYTGNNAGKFGAGLILGEPTGVSLKYWLDDTMAIDGAIGASSDDDSRLYLHSDVLWHNFDLLPVTQGRLPVYFGIGGLVRFRDHNHDDEVGIRVPLGLSYMFDNAPVDIFAEIGPAIDLAPDVHGEITGGIGIRFWF